MTEPFYSPAPGPKPYSLQRRLLWLLFAAIALVASVQAIIAYRSALSQADIVFDQQMKQLALAFRSGQIRADTASGRVQPVEELQYEVQVWSADGRSVYQSSRRTVVPARRKPGYSVAKTGDKTYRVFSLSNRGRSVQVSQDLQARASEARRMAFASALPVALLVPVLMALTGWLVRRSLRPVERARKEFAQRQPNDLAPVSDAGLPSEVQPMVGELNELFGRVSESLEAQKNFVADAAHELRSPLAALKVQVQNLRRAHEGGDELQYGYSLQRLEQGVDRAARLVDQLLSLARHQTSMSEGGQGEPVALQELARDCIAQLAPLAADRQIDLGLAASESLVVQGWPETLQILLRNLIENAIKYTPAGGVVDISVALQNNEPTLLVEDSGPGIEPGQRERVLDRFYRGPHDAHDDEAATQRTATSKPPTGSGLGLAIVKSIAERHGARLELTPSSRLGGLRVSASFPVPASGA